MRKWPQVSPGGLDWESGKIPSLKGWSASAQVVESPSLEVLKKCADVILWAGFIGGLGRAGQWLDSLILRTFP